MSIPDVKGSREEACGRTYWTGHKACRSFCLGEYPQQRKHLKSRKRDFPGGPVVKTSPSNAGGVSLIPGWGAKMPHASQPKNQNIKQKQYCNKFNKDFKNGPHQKKILKTNKQTNRKVE